MVLKLNMLSHPFSIIISVHAQSPIFDSYFSPLATLFFFFIDLQRFLFNAFLLEEVKR